MRRRYSFAVLFNHVMQQLHIALHPFLESFFIHLSGIEDHLSIAIVAARFKGKHHIEDAEHFLINREL
ncbi:hypothetical protein D3C84_981050 [compost metagenome]